MDDVLLAFTLNTADHIMVSGARTLGGDTERVMPQDRATSDTSRKTLLHTTVEKYNRNSRRRLGKGGALLD